MVLYQITVLLGGGEDRYLVTPLSHMERQLKGDNLHAAAGESLYPSLRRCPVGEIGCVIAYSHPVLLRLNFSISFIPQKRLVISFLVLSFLRWRIIKLGRK